MKKIISIAVCFFILLSCVIPVQASGGVPEKVMESTKSVVRILSKYYSSSATGSGFVIKNEPGEVLIATNDHVVSGNPYSISVWVGENELVDAEIVFTTSAKDLCVLRVTDPIDMKPLTLSTEEPQHGAAIYVVGYPGAGDILSDTQAHTSDSVTITDGIISAIRTFTIENGAAPVKLLQVNAAINSGNSGGPLFNSEGVVIGVNTYKVNANSQGVFGSVAISELWSLLDQYGIEIPEEPVIVEAEGEKVLQESSFLIPVLICAGVVGLLLAVILLAKSKSRYPQKRKRRSSTVQVVTLQTYMDRYPQGLGIGGAVSLLLPVAIQLRNLHNDGKLHLQICPENILIGADGASLKNPSAQETGRFNSGFAAPEIYRGAGFGITSDIYSFAAVLIYATTGKVPANSLQQEALDQSLELLEDTAFAVVIRKAMASSILDRIQSMQELIYSIAVYNVPVQEKQPVKAAVPAPEKAEKPAPAVEEKRKTPKPRKQAAPKKKTVKLLPVAAVLACGLVAVVLLWNPAAKQEEIAVSAEQETTVPETTVPETTEPLSPEEIAYAEAEALLANGETGKAAIAFGKLGDYKDARERSYALWDHIAYRETISDNIYLKADGTVIAAPHAPNFSKKDLNGIQDVIAVSNGCWNGSIDFKTHAVVLKADGTVAAAGENVDGRCDVNGWANIVQIDAGADHTVGLQADGTVIAVGNNEYGQCNVGDWSDIVAVSAALHTVGLKADGTVVATGTNEVGQCEVSHWTDIVAVAAGGNHTVGLKADGTVVATTYTGDRRHYGDACEVTEWSDIIAISAGYRHTLGLKSDGTVVAIGESVIGACNVDEWKNIVAISTSTWSSYGLKTDGTSMVNNGILKGRVDIAIPGQLSSKPATPHANQQAQYDAAEKLLADGETAKAAIAFGKLGDYADARERSFALWDKVVQRTVLDSGYNITMAVRADGTVVSAGYHGHTNCNFDTWADITSISISDWMLAHAVGLRSDGTVVSTGHNSQGQCEVTDWTDIVQVKANGHCTIGLRMDGTVVVAGASGLAIPDIKEIVAIGASHGGFVFLKADGTIIAVGFDDAILEEVHSWSDIVEIEVGWYNIIGLRSNGTVVAVGENSLGQCNVSDWTDIISVSSASYHTVGLRSDGTVVATGKNSDGQCKISNWRNIVAVSTGTDKTIGLCADGTVIYAGKGDKAIKEWNGVKLPY